MKKDPLTPHERMRLCMILEPYKDRFTGLRKQKFTGNTEFILLQFTEPWHTVADMDAEVEETEGPSFPAGCFFKGLELDKFYTAEDLALW